MLHSGCTNFTWNTSVKKNRNKGMKISHFSLLAVGVWNFLSGISFSQDQEPLILSGTVGDYKIEMEIQSVGWQDGVLVGRYKYAGKEKYLDLEGFVFGSCFDITEYYKGEATGEFYLTTGEENTFFGKWVSGSKSHDVNLKYVSGDLKMLNTKVPADYASCVSDDITGIYITESFFLNDWFFREDSPELEIGYNGGHLMVEDTGDDSINFSFQVVCGPTYHFAIASGRCKKTGNKAKFVIPYYGDDDSVEDSDCIIEFQFSDKSISASANGSMSCGFGARAYLDHTFTKVGNKVNFDEDAVIEELYCRD